MKKILAAFAALTIGASALMAGGNIQSQIVPVSYDTDNGFYVGGGYTYIDNDVLVDHKNAATGLVGYNFNKYIAVEGRATVITEEGVKDSTGVLTGGNWAIFAKPQYNVTEDIKAYALLGAGKAKYVDGVVVDDDVQFQFGAGASVRVTDKVDVFADWVRQKDNHEADIVTLGAQYRF